jgi:4-alpha-glucanotransferase
LRWIELMSAAGWGYWQMLPIHPTEPRFDDSPYHSTSAHAGNPLFISPEWLVQEGWLRPDERNASGALPGDRVDYVFARRLKRRLLHTAFRRFSDGQVPSDFERFCETNSGWLEDFALFSVLRRRFRGSPWPAWPVPLRDRHPEALGRIRAESRQALREIRFLQYVFARQWRDLREHARTRGVRLIGDLPIYVTLDSADVWAAPRYFQLKADRRPAFAAGVPPDYFSRTGQLWGNPLYRWPELKREGFRWWLDRLALSLERFDLLRIDHFRGLVSYWKVPAGARTAKRGRWQKAPAAEFLERIREEFPLLPFIAEDLGTITPDVVEIRERFGLRGMKVLQFAFNDGNPDHPFLPHTYPTRCVAYTGTHDNNTLRGWYEDEIDNGTQKRVLAYLGRYAESSDVVGGLIRLLLGSPADLAVLPVQDLLGLGSEARMNLPGSPRGNWRWRLTPDRMEAAFCAEASRRLGECGRSL